MIPLKLQIRNFISYGPKSQTIDFEPYNLICLVGKNGHGKSALLDALTWAIWGQARKVGSSSKADEGLLRLGETNMMVCLDFTCNKITYRIRREFSLIGRKPYSLLEFGILDQSIPGDAVGQLRPLTDKTIRATQDKIDTLIGLNYESFINSAFLRQGQSNEFSKKTPKERKDILASILGLDKFEKLKKISQDKNKEALQKKEYSYRTKEQLIKSLEQKSTILFQLNQVCESLDIISENYLLLKTTLQTIRKELSEIGLKKNQIGQLNFEITQLDTAIIDLTSQVLENFKQRQETFRKKKELSDVKDVDQKYNLLVQKRKELQALSNEKFLLKEFLLNKKEEERICIEQITDTFSKRTEKNKLLDQEYQTNLKNIEQRVKEHEEVQNKFQQEHLQLKNIIDNQVRQEQNLLTSIRNYLSTNNTFIGIEAFEKQLNKRKDHYHKYSAQIKVIEHELINLLNKQKLIITDNDPSCPLCKQSITEDHKSTLIHDSQKILTTLNHKIKRFKNLAIALHKIIKEQELTINLTKKKIEEQNILTIQLYEQKKQFGKIAQNIDDRKAKILLCCNDSKNHQNNINHVREENVTIVKELQDTLDNYPNLNAIKLAVQQASIQLKEIDIKLQEEPQIDNQILALEELKQKHIAVLNALALQEQRKANIKQFCSQATKLKQIKKEKVNELSQLVPLINHEFKFLQEENMINQNLQKILIEKETYVLKKGSLEQQLSVIKQKEAELIDQKKLITELEQSSEDYKAISLALGKDGIQALLIEDAIPEIEHEANALLTRLTDNQSHLTIESVRDLKTGGTKETLDIKISDPVGVRAYELFSGGEAFRIDFALRIAISKLLARRAGTSLETLIIDEGFGSQDEEGLSSIMEVIYKIQNDFEKVIIVSHLTSMKEQFPINFLVHKGPQGSQIKVIDQG